MMDHPDFSVVVKNKGRHPSPRKWEIYRAGQKKPGQTTIGPKPTLMACRNNRL